MQVDCLIIGAGLAGLNAASAIKEIDPKLTTAIIDAGGAASSEIMGFSAPVATGDSVELFASDTLKAGNGYARPELVNTLAEQAIPTLKRLERLGIQFDRKSDASYDCLHAVGTSFPRVVHSGTTTGKQAMQLLKSPVISNRVSKILVSQGRVWGVLCQDGQVISAKAVILTGGGFAGLWKFSTWSKNLRGDSLLLALDAGVELCDLGFIQFEPTVAVYPEKLAGFPIITTVLHEGARLVDKQGKSLLDTDYIPPKRQLAILIEQAIQAGRSLDHGGICYDFSQVNQDNFAQRYPEYHKLFSQFAPSFKDLCFEVKPGAHTTLGGIVIDKYCTTNIKGLFAAGEVIGGLHGAERLGGNAGLEVFVFGQIAGISAAKYVKSNDSTDLTQSKPTLPKVNAAIPENIYTRIGEILDKYFTVITDTDTLDRGIAQLDKLIPSKSTTDNSSITALVNFVKLVFAQAKRHLS